MKQSLRGVVAVGGCIAIIAFALLLLDYGRKHEVASIVMLGYTLDAIVITGIVGNVIVFLLAKTTKLNPLRAAFWTFLVVNGVPAVVLAIIGPRMGTQFNLGAVVLGYFVSFLFWFGIHWLWSQSKSPTQITT